MESWPPGAAPASWVWPPSSSRTSASPLRSPFPSLPDLGYGYSLCCFISFYFLRVGEWGCILGSWGDRGEEDQRGICMHEGNCFSFLPSDPCHSRERKIRPHPPAGWIFAKACTAFENSWNKLCLSPSQSWITLSPFSLSLPLFNFFSMIAINGGGKGCPIPMTGDCHPTWSFGWRWGASMYSSISYKVPPPATGLWFFSSKLLITCSLSQSPPVVKFYFTIIYAMKYLQMKLCTLGFVSK